MPNPPVLARVAGVLLAFLWLPAAARAIDRVDDDYPNLHFAQIVVNLRDNGHVDGNLVVYGRSKENGRTRDRQSWNEDRRKWTEALERFLGGPITEQHPCPKTPAWRTSTCWLRSAPDLR